MKNLISKAVMFVALIAALSSCTTLNQSMREPNTKVNFTKSDFALSEQVSGEATTVKIIGIDWARLFMQKGATLEGSSATISTANIPVIGNLITDKTANYALYELMVAHPGYDVVFYPQYEKKVIKPFLGIGLLTTITTVKAKAKLGKLK